MTREKMEKIVLIIISACFAILMITMAWGMFKAYEIGIDQGREEAVQMITNFTDKYTFTEVESNENGRIMGSFGSTKYFPNSNNTLLDCYYDWDGSLKIGLKKLK